MEANCRFFSVEKDSIICSLCNCSFKNLKKTIDEHLDGVKHKQKFEDIKGKSSSNRNQELFSKTLFVYNAQKLHNPNEELIQYFGKYSNTVEVEKVQRNAWRVTVDDEITAKIITKKNSHKINNVFIIISSHNKLQTENNKKDSEKETKFIERWKKVWFHLLKNKNVDEQMLTIYNEWKLTNKKIKSFKKIAANLQETISQVYPESTIHIFGSSATEFGFRGDADLDLVLLLNNTWEGGRLDIYENVCDIVDKFCPTLSITKQGDYKNGDKSTRFYILKLRHNVFKIKVDLVFFNYFAVINTNYQRLLSRLNPQLKYLVFFVRFWMRQGEVKKTELNSYAITLLVIFFMQQTFRLPKLVEIQKNLEEKLSPYKTNCVLPEESDWNSLEVSNRESFRTLLRDFFQFFASASATPFNKIVFNTRECQIVHKTRDVMVDRAMNILDPFETSHNIVNHCLKTVTLRNLISSCWDCLKMIKRKDFVSGEGIWGLPLLFSKPKFASYHDNSGRKISFKLQTYQGYSPSHTAGLLYKVLNDVFRIKFQSSLCFDEEESKEEIKAMWKQHKKQEICEVADERAGRKRSIQPEIKPSKRCKISCPTSKFKIPSIELPFSCQAESKHKVWLGRRKMKRNMKVGAQGTMEELLRVEAMISNMIISNTETDSNSSFSSLSTDPDFSLFFNFSCSVDSLQENLNVSFELPTVEMKSDFTDFVHYLRTFIPSFLVKIYNKI